MPAKKPSAKKEDVGQVVRRWESSPILYGYDSRFDRKPNPDYHPPIRLTHLGKFIDDAGKVLDPAKEVPAYVREQAKGTSLDIEFRPRSTRQLSMRDAMLGAGVENTDPDPDNRRRPGARPEVFA